MLPGGGGGWVVGWGCSSIPPHSVRSALPQETRLSPLTFLSLQDLNKILEAFGVMERWNQLCNDLRAKIRAAESHEQPSKGEISGQPASLVSVFSWPEGNIVVRCKWIAFVSMCAEVQKFEWKYPLPVTFDNVRCFASDARVSQVRAPPPWSVFLGGCKDVHCEILLNLRIQNNLRQFL